MLFNGMQDLSSRLSSDLESQQTGESSKEAYVTQATNLEVDTHGRVSYASLSVSYLYILVQLCIYFIRLEIIGANGCFVVFGDLVITVS